MLFFKVVNFYIIEFISPAMSAFFVFSASHNNNALRYAIVSVHGFEKWKLTCLVVVDTSRFLHPAASQDAIASHHHVSDAH